MEWPEELHAAINLRYKLVTICVHALVCTVPYGGNLIFSEHDTAPKSVRVEKLVSQTHRKKELQLNSKIINYVIAKKKCVQQINEPISRSKHSASICGMLRDNLTWAGFVIVGIATLRAKQNLLIDLSSGSNER